MSSFILKWKNTGDQQEVILLMDANKDVSEASSLLDFAANLNLADVVPMIDQSLAEDPTYLWSLRHLNYAFITPGLQAAVLNAGHHPFTNTW